jgi:hypothetical protein
MRNLQDKQEGMGQKKEAALPQHYLSPNQIKPNYNFLT